MSIYDVFIRVDGGGKGAVNATVGVYDQKDPSGVKKLMAFPSPVDDPKKVGHPTPVMVLEQESTSLPDSVNVNDADRNMTESERTRHAIARYLNAELDQGD